MIQATKLVTFYPNAEWAALDVDELSSSNNKLYFMGITWCVYTGVRIKNKIAFIIQLLTPFDEDDYSGNNLREDLVHVLDEESLPSSDILFRSPYYYDPIVVVKGIKVISGNAKCHCHSVGTLYKILFATYSEVYGLIKIWTDRIFPTCENCSCRLWNWSARREIEEKKYFGIFIISDYFNVFSYKNKTFTMQEINPSCYSLC